MRLRTAITMALIMSGKYDLPRTVTVQGLDQYGEPFSETNPDIDSERLEADVDKVLAGLMPSPIKSISGLRVKPRVKPLSSNVDGDGVSLTTIAHP
jgi:hypothetical protein